MGKNINFKGALCSVASVLSSGVLMVSNVSAATITYYSGTKANDGEGTSVLAPTLRYYNMGTETEYRGLYSVGSIAGVLDDANAEGTEAFTNIIKDGFAFNNWKASYYQRGWNKISGTKTPGTDFTSTSYNLKAVAQWTDLKKAVTLNDVSMVNKEASEIKDDAEELLGKITFSYDVKLVSDKAGDPVVVDNINEEFEFSVEKEGYEYSNVTAKIGDAAAEDITEDVQDDGKVTLEGVKEKAVAITAEMGLKEFNVAASVTDEEHASVSPIPPVEYGASATFDVTIDEGYKASRVLKGEEETELVVEDGQLVIENITADAEYTIVIEPEVYKVIDGDGQDIDVAEVDKALFRFDGPFDLFVGLTVDDKEFTAYEVSEGSTLVAIAKDDLIALGEGEHNIKAFYSNGTFAEANFTISNIPTTPETGANSKAAASTIASVVASAATGSVLALVLLALKRKFSRR